MRKEVQVRRKKRLDGGRVLGFGALFAVLLLLGFFAYQALWGPASPQFVRAASGTIHHETAVDIIFVNREYPLQAAVAGQVEFKGSDGERFRRGETVADIVQQGVTPGTSGTGVAVSVQAPHGGLLYKTVDGLETLYTPENLLSMDLAKLLAQEGKLQTLQLVRPGQVFGKIVDNLSPTEAFVKLPSLDGLTVGKDISLVLGGTTETARILRKSEAPMGVVVVFDSFIDGSVQTREQKAQWNTRPATRGTVIPRTALWESEGKEGIYVVSAGVIDFRPIQVLDQDDTRICVKDLSLGVLVVTNPRRGLQGMSALKN